MMNIPSMRELKDMVMGKVQDKVASSVLDKVGLGDLSALKGITGFNFDSFNLDNFSQLPRDQQMSKILTIGGAAVAGMGLLGYLGKMSGVGALENFSDKTFPILLGIGSIAAIAGIGIPMYQKFKEQGPSNEQNAVLNSALSGSSENVSLEGGKSILSNLNIEGLTNKIDGFSNNLKNQEPAPALPSPKLSV